MNQTIINKTANHILKNCKLEVQQLKKEKNQAAVEERRII